MSKKIRNIIIFSVLGAIILAIVIFSILSYVNYENYRKGVEAGLSIIHILNL